MLRSIHRRLPSEGGALLIGEMLLNGAEEAPGPVNALMQDLNMMVSDGGERTRAGRWGATAGSSGGGGGGGSWAHERVFVKYLFQELGMVMRVLVCCSKTGRGLDPSMPLSSPPPTTLPIPLSCADNHGKSILPPIPSSPPPPQVQTLGRERSLEGYRMLLSQAGFDPQRVHGMRTGAYLDAVIAYK